MGGLNSLQNSGTCSLFVGTLDSSGNVLDDVKLDAGNSLYHYQPAAGGASVYAVCINDCNGTATLNYDDPDLVA